MKKQKREKLTCYKAALRQISLHEKAVNKGQEVFSETVNSFKKDISKFINKNGTLSKRALRSNKARKEFNAIVKSFKGSKQATKKQRKETYNKQLNTFQNRGYASNKKEFNNILNVFTALSSDYMKDKLGFGSNQIMDISDHTDGVSKDDIQKVAQYIIKDMEDNTPSFLSQYLSVDDTYKVMKDTLSLMDEYELSPDEIKNAFDKAKEFSDANKNYDVDILLSWYKENGNYDVKE